MLKGDKEGRERHHSSHLLRGAKLQLCYSQELRGLTEKGKLNDARQYCDHLWMNSGSQGNNRQEPYREF